MNRFARSWMLKRLYAVLRPAYEQEAKLLNAEICGMMTDEAIPTVEALTPKLLEAAKRRDEAEAKAAAATAEARQLSGELNL